MKRAFYRAQKLNDFILKMAEKIVCEVGNPIYLKIKKKFE